MSATLRTFKASFEYPLCQPKTAIKKLTVARFYTKMEKRKNEKMKRNNLTIIVTIIAAFGVLIFAFQPVATIEASSSAAPFATPSPRTKRPKTIQSPKPIQSPITKTKTKSSGVKEGGANDTTFRKSNKSSIRSIERSKQLHKRSKGKRVHKR